MFKNDQHLFNP